MPDGRSRIVACVPAHREHAALGCLLHVLVESGAFVEVILAVNNAPPGAGLTWASVPAGVRIVETANAGQAAAINAACRSADFDTLLCLDYDVKVDVAMIAAICNELTAQSSVAVTSFQVQPVEIESTPAKHFESVGGLSKRRTSLLLAPQKGKPYSLLDVPPHQLVVGAVLAVTAGAVACVGPFDERFAPGARYGHGHALDFAYRTLKAGLPVRFVAESGVLHHHPQTRAGLLYRARQYGRGDGALLAKWFIDHHDTEALRELVDARVRRLRRWPLWSRSPELLAFFLLREAATLAGCVEYAGRAAVHARS